MEDDELLARIDERHVLVHLNGKLIRGSKTRNAALEEGYTLAFMVLGVGG